MSLVPVDPTNALAVTDYLTKARDWLATAVENTGPEQIAAAKAEIATAAEATKQLGLSKEIQHDAAEMVRRAEWTLRKATKKAQEAGEMRSRETNLQHNSRNVGTSASTLPSPRDLFATEVEYRDALAMGELEAEEFEAVLAEAKTEGNLSRANVARKAREQAGVDRARPRQPAETSLNLIASHADKAAREAQKLTADQIRRVKPNAADWVDGIRASVEALERLLTSLTQEK